MPNRRAALIVNPRGPSGSGKTELVRRLMNELLSRPAAPLLDFVYSPGGARPIACRLAHPLGGAPLVVLGHYERKSGGCDTIRESDGGMQEAFRIAASSVSAGHSVLMEGLRLSSDHAHSSALAARHELHIIRLTTSAEDCARNLIRRRRLSREASRNLCQRIAEEQLGIDAACERLCPCAVVHRVAFNDAASVARRLLHLPAASFAGSG